jgi:CheY-like chemotaxis protein
MLVEDDFTMRSLLRTLLRFEGFDVAAVEDETDFDQVLKNIAQEAPEILLMDVHLRQLNGVELLQAIRKDRVYDAIGIIMSSGSDMRDRCLESGADAFILKPYMPEELIQKINQVMMGRRRPA